MRIVTNNDVLKIIKDKEIIKLTLLDREGPYVGSKILKEVYTPKLREGYDIPQFGVGEPNSHEIIDSFYCEDIDMVIWGVKELVEVDISEDLEEQVHWYFDKGEL